MLDLLRALGKGDTFRKVKKKKNQWNIVAAARFQKRNGLIGLIIRKLDTVQAKLPAGRKQRICC